jgi:hypothetical protein
MCSVFMERVAWQRGDDIIEKALTLTVTVSMACLYGNSRLVTSDVD